MSPTDLPEVMERIMLALPGRVQRDNDEIRFQDSIAAALGASDVAFVREARAEDGSRFDFLCPGRDDRSVAIEVKVKGGLNDLIRQCGRYLWRTDIAGLVVATTRAIHTRVPPELNSKPIRIFWASFP